MAADQASRGQTYREGAALECEGGGESEEGSSQEEEADGREKGEAPGKASLKGAVDAQGSLTDGEGRYRDPKADSQAGAGRGLRGA